MTTGIDDRLQGASSVVREMAEGISPDFANVQLRARRQQRRRNAWAAMCLAVLGVGGVVALEGREPSERARVTSNSTTDVMFGPEGSDWTIANATVDGSDPGSRSADFYRAGATSRWDLLLRVTRLQGSDGQFNGEFPILSDPEATIALADGREVRLIAQDGVVSAAWQDGSGLLFMSFFDLDGQGVSIAEALTIINTLAPMDSSTWDNALEESVRIEGPATATSIDPSAGEGS